VQRKDVAIAPTNGDIYTSRLLSKFIFMPRKIDQQGEVESLLVLAKGVEIYMNTDLLVVAI
jgi:hypothetical protein